MDATSRGNGLIASLWGAAGVFLIGFFGAEALFAPGTEGLPLSATLVPAIVAAVGAFIFLMTQPLGGAEEAACRKPEPRALPRTAAGL